MASVQQTWRMTNDPAEHSARAGRPRRPSGATRSPRTPGPPNAAEKILASAVELFRERGPAAVSLREIARHAGVNYGLIHHYYGTKEGVLAAVFRMSAERGERVLDDVADSATALAILAHDPRAFARMLAFAVLESDSSQVFESETPGIRKLRELIEHEWTQSAAGTLPPPSTRTAFDPRVIAATSVLTVLGWSLLSSYLVPASGLAERDPDDLNAEVLEVLQCLIRATAPGQTQTP
jgi:AcrR family transcriptional regulator